jgi:hypothetical protein
MGAVGVLHFGHIVHQFLEKHLLSNWMNLAWPPGSPDLTIAAPFCVAVCKEIYLPIHGF